MSDPTPIAPRSLFPNTTTLTTAFSSRSFTPTPTPFPLQRQLCQPALTLSRFSHQLAESAHDPPNDISFLFTNSSSSTLNLPNIPNIPRRSPSATRSETPTWLERRIFFRSPQPATTSLMGQGQAKLEGASASTSSSQTQSQNHSLPQSPARLTIDSIQPYSQPMQTDPTDVTWSRIDYGPGPADKPLTRPVPVGPNASDSKRIAGIARKLSKARIKRDAFSESRLGNNNDDVQTTGSGVVTELLSLRGGVSIKTASPQTPQFLHSTKTMKASTFSALKRNSIPLSPIIATTATTSFPPSSTVPRPFPVLAADFSPIPLPKVTKTLPPRASPRPQPPQTPKITHHRKSTSSGRSSIKSPRRAEREWRAKVAALSCSSTGQNNSSVYPALRGPVPPPRPSQTPSNSKGASGINSAQSSPDEDIVTPLLIQRCPPSKSSSSGRSFATLGHHIHLQAKYVSAGHQHQNDTSFLSIDSPSTSAGKRTSIAPSISSFYFNPNGSRVSTRPSSIAADRLLIPLRSPDSASPTSPLKNQDTPRPSPTQTRHTDTINFTPSSSPQQNQRTLPPFASFQLSPISVGDDFKIDPTPVPSSTSSNQMKPQFESFLESKKLDSGSSTSRRHSLPDTDSILREVRYLSLPNTSSAPPTGILDVTVDKNEKRNKATLNLLFDIVSPHKRHNQHVKANSIGQTSTSPITPKSQQPHTRPRESPPDSDGNSRSAHFSPSPTTAYILSAPNIERLAWSKGLKFPSDNDPPSPLASRSTGSRQGGDRSKQGNGLDGSRSQGHSREASGNSDELGMRLGQKHPFAMTVMSSEKKKQVWDGDRISELGFADMTISPLPPSCPPIPRFTLYESRSGSEADHADPFFISSSQGPHSKSTSSQQLSQVSFKRDRITRPRTRQQPTISHHPSSIHQSHLHQQSASLGVGRALKSQILGTSTVTNQGKIGKLGELVPGKRPPKSGLPIDDLQRWLAQTAITS